MLKIKISKTLKVEIKNDGFKCKRYVPEIKHCSPFYLSQEEIKKLSSLLPT